MATDTTKITGAADELSAGLTKGGSAAKTLGAEIANAIKSLDDRVSAIEAGGSTQPPIEPPVTAGPTGGHIDTFSATPNTDCVIDGVRYRVWGAGKPYSFNQIDQYTLRYEIRPGDHGTAGLVDQPGCDRCQIDGYQKKYADGTVIKVGLRVMVEPGPANAARWFVIGEQQQQQISTSPFLSLDLEGERFSVSYRNDPNNQLPPIRPWTQSTNLVRGQWYVFELEFRVSQSNGYLKARVDGAEVVNYTGRLGFSGTTESYWMTGLYRETATGQINIATQVKNMTVIT